MTKKHMNNDQASDGTEGGENFEELLNRTYKEPSRLEPGQKIEAGIVKITAEWALLEVGGKGEGYLDKKELLGPDGNLTVKEGDKIRVYFLRSDGGEMHFTSKIGSGPAARAQLEEARRDGIPVEGTLSKELNGGFEVVLSGGARAFCPYSQMGIRREENKGNYLGRTMSFDVLECGDRNTVLSRKGILEKERQAAEKALKETLEEGARIKGTVTSIQKFGAFVDIGGVEGLLPVSEISWSRTEKVGDALSVGQAVEVSIKKLDWANNRISLSLRDILPDPWDLAVEKWAPGSYHTGTVSRLAPFGAFVTLGEGVDGLIHISRLGGDRKLQSPDEAVKAGQAIEVRVESVDRANKKISLIPAEAGREQEESAAVLNSYQKREQAEPQSLGTFGEALKKQMEKKAQSAG
jgi:small subunit ribosomal protein S1